MLDRLRTTLRARDAARDYLRPRHREEVFTKIYSENLWGNAESRSGPVLCRDCLQHLPTRLILSALDRFKASGAKWIFLATNENVRANQDGVIGGSRPINLQLPPFNFPPPVEKIAEDGEGRCLALWRL